jgi:hypothetical protein
MATTNDGAQPAPEQLTPYERQAQTAGTTEWAARVNTEMRGQFNERIHDTVETIRKGLHREPMGHPGSHS